MEFCLLDVIRYYIKNKYFILVISILFLLGGIIYTNNYMDYKYESDTDILVGSCLDNCQTISYDDLELANGLIDGYIELIYSKKVISLVIDELELDMDYKEVKNLITVSHEEDSYFVNIAVKTNDGELSSLIANEVVKQLSIVALEVYKVDNIYVVNDAKVSAEAVNSKIFYDIIFVILGFILSSLMVLVGFCFDRRIFNNCDKDIYGIPLFGMISFKLFDKNKFDLNDLSYSDQFLNIGNRLKLITLRGKCIVFSNVDKTDVSFTTLNMARTLTMMGNKVMVIDGNLDGNLTKLFKVDGKKGLLDYLKGRLKLENIICKITGEKIDFIPVGINDELELLSTNKFRKLLDLLEGEYDYILIDTRRIDSDSRVKSILGNKLDIILVCTEYKTRVNNIDNLLNEVKYSDSGIRGMVIYNR